MAGRIGTTNVPVPSPKIYATDAGGSRVVLIDDMTGASLVAYGSAGVGQGRLYGPGGVFVR